MSQSNNDNKFSLVEKLNEIISKTGASFMEAAKCFKSNGKDIQKTIKELLSKGFQSINTECKEKTIYLGLLEDKKKFAKVIFGCLTDFVSNLKDFQNLQIRYAEALLNDEDLSELKKEKDILTKATKENITIISEETKTTDGFFYIYTHHTRKKAICIEYFIDNNNDDDIKEFVLSAILHSESDIEKLKKMENLVGKKTLSDIIKDNQIKIVYNYIL